MKKKSTKLWKRIFSVFLTIAIVASTIAAYDLGSNQSNVWADVEMGSGPADGQVEYEGGTTEYEGQYGYDLEVSKTIEAVEGKENYFDITLTATTKRHPKNTDTDVVMVMDVSNTMNKLVANPSASVDDQYETRIYAVKAAVNSFLDGYSTNDNLDNKRFGLVTFNTNANAVLPMTEIEDWNDAYRIQTEVVNGITASSDYKVKFTNVEAGLQLAYNMLKDSTAKYKYVVLLTDGFPTTYINDTISGNRESTSQIVGYNTYMTETYGYAYNQKIENSKVDEEGYFADVNTKKICAYGVDYSNRGALKAESIAGTIKANDINVFSIGVALGEQTINGYIQNFANLDFTTTDTTGMTVADVQAGNFAIGKENMGAGAVNDGSAYKNWLRDTIAGGTYLSESADRYLDGDAVAEISNDLQKILKNIEIIPVTEMRKFYTLDPMGENIEFLYFFDKDGNIVTTNELVGESKLGAEDTAVYGGEDNEDRINWNLIQSGYTSKSVDGTNYYIFDLKYRVRLENESEDYYFGAIEAANGTTTLEFETVYEDGSPGPTDTVDYEIPEVEGYCGSLKFKKIDKDTGEVLNNVGFTLQHYGTNCSVCEGDATIADVTNYTDENGYVEFTEIPSGHEYKLVEIVPDGYKPAAGHAVIVSYGDTYIDSISPENKLVNGKLNGGNGDEFIIENDKVEPVELQIQVSKTMDGAVPAAGTFEFKLSGKTQYGADYHEVVKNDASGKVTFSKMNFSVPGTYEYTISEVAGSDQSVVYDETIHTVKIIVSEDKSISVYKAAISIDGGPTLTYVGTEGRIEIINAGSFANETRIPVKKAFEVKKTFLDEDDNEVTLQGGEFTFQLKDESGNVLQTKTNAADGSVVFDEIEYDATGVYNYTISEVNDFSDAATVYDTTVYDVEVNVEISADKKSFEATVVYKENGTAVTGTPEFVNSDRKPAKLTLAADKTLNGAAAAEGEFGFKLVEVDLEGKETVIQETTNAANGVITFDAITFDEPATKGVRATSRYTYRIYETTTDYVTNDGESIKCDTNYYEVVVEVDSNHGDSFYLYADLYKVDVNGNRTYLGQQTGTDVTLGGVNSSLDISFVNTSTVKLSLEADKTLLDASGNKTSLASGAYTFTLSDATGKVLQTKTNTNDGTVAFDEIEYTAKDARTYRYIVQEVAGNEPGMYYDDTIYTAEVTVSVDANGHLSISEPTIINDHDESAGTMSFVNKPVDPTHMHLYATKTVDGKIPTLDQKFQFVLKQVDEEGNVLETIETVHETGGTAVFKEVVFTEEGIYYYTVSEVIPEGAVNNTLDGMTYDTAVYNVKAVVTKNATGSLERKIYINGSEDTAITFDNSYTAKPAEAVFAGTKTLEGKDLIEGQFTFKLTAVTAGAPMPTETTVTNNADGTFSFPAISYDKAGEYKYTVSEVKGNLGGVTYDETVYNVTVKVTDNNKGQLEAVTTVNNVVDGSITFKNSYGTTPTAVRFTAKKSLTNHVMEKGEFTFVLLDEEGNEIERVTNGQLTGSAIDDIRFSTISYTSAGTYKYTMKEVIPDNAVDNKLDGITYTNTVKEITVNVTDDGAGKLVAKVGETVVGTYDAGTFENTYDTEPVSVTLDGTKTLGGRTLAADEFTFKLTAVTAGAPMPTEATEITVTNDAEGKFAFPAISYDEVGEYKYTVSEVKGSLGGITYDKTVYNVTVKVTDNGKGKLEAAVAVDGRTDLAIKFYNEYKAAEETLALNVSKDFTGREGDEWLETDEFTFEMIVNDNVTNAAIQAGTVILPTNASGIKIEEQGQTASFGDITFKAAGTYKFIIREIDSEEPGITYDQYPREVVVTVTDNGNGKLAVDYTISAGRELTFVNKYDTTSEDLSGHQYLKVTKILNGRDWLDSDAFTFTLAAADDDTKAAVAKYNADAENKEGIELPETILTVTKENKTYPHFGDIIFHEEGTFKFSITETAEIAGVENDANAVRYITVEVVDNDAGELVATIVNDETEDLTFTNTYKTTSAKAAFEGIKTLTGKTLEAGAFEFELKAVTSGAPMPATAVVTNDADGNFAFDEIEYTKAGSYVYTISEKAGTDESMIYDDTVYNVLVTITDDNAGKLSADVKYRINTTRVETVEFENIVRNDAEITLEGTKNLAGRDLAAGEFSFVLKDSAGAEIETVQNTEAGTFAFEALTYSQVGEYKYTVSEVKESLGGVTYDETVYTVTVNVTVGSDGHLTASKTIEANGKAAAGIAFQNSYASAGEMVLTGTKSYVDASGTAKEMTEGQFSFVLKDSEGEEVETVTNKADGTFAFETIKYNKAGEYKYTVSEVEGNAGGVQYDKTVYNVTVTVTDNGKGSLVVSKTINGSADTNIAFVNSYGTAEVDVPLTATKTLEGRTLAANEFSFQLKAKDGTVLQTQYNKADGTVVFDDLKFNSEGTYEYTVSENRGSIDTITYDETIYHVKVVVSDDNAGKLVADVTITSGEEEVAAIAFNNKYIPRSTDIVLTATKTLEGRDLKDKEFSFQLKDEAGNVLQTKENAADGSITFEPISYDKAGTHTYTVSEVKGHSGGVSYDDTVYKVVVTVTDDYEGNLTVTKTVDGSADKEMVFENTYTTQPTKIVLTATKVYQDANGTPKNITEGQFTFELKDSSGNVLQTKTNDANGNVTFDAIEYKEKGDYTYSVYEIVGSEPGVHYDTEVRTVVVNVTDNGQGYLAAAVNGDADGEVHVAEFVNVYKPDSVSVTFDVKKEFTETDGTAKEIAEGQFKFHLADGNADLIQEISIGADGTAEFDTITFTEAGTYQYKIHEVRGGTSHNGIDYSAASYEITVEVKDIGGKLAAYIDGTEGSGYTAEFTNVYNPAEAKVVLKAHKILEGRDLKADEFTFELKDAEGNVIESKTNNADGTVTFSTLTYEETGSYTYTVSEENNGLGGIDYDTKEYKVTVEVTDNEEKGELEATVEVDGESYDLESSMTFHNKYDVEPVDVVLKAYKTLEGRDLAAEEFYFELRDEFGNVIQTKANSADRTVTFDTLTFKETGEHTFTISEVHGSLGGVTYDASVYTVKVFVTDNGQGNLVAAVTVNGEGYVVGSEQILFKNIYTTKPTEFNLTANKTLDGKTLHVDAFTFELKDAEGNVLQTKNNASDGSITFDPITYEEAGTHTYTVSEVKGTSGGVTYDETIYTVVVKVTDNGAGSLAAVPTIKVGDAEASAIEFKNTYVPEPTNLILTAHKILEGRDLKAEEFTFELKDAEGNVLQTKKNAADGSVKFDAIEYKVGEEGEYLYTISEVEGTTAGMTYDKTVYTVVVEVADNEEGSLVAKVEGVEVTEKHVGEFKNTYVAPPVSTHLSAKKTLKGGTLKADQFTFILEDSKGNVVQKVTNDADGNIDFGSITFNNPGQYAYLVSEVKGDDATMIYDTTVYKVVFTVKETADKTLKVSKTIYESGSEEVAEIEFVNRIYSETPEEPKTPGQTNGTQTGDTANTLMWGAALVLAGASAVGIGLKKKKEE